VFLKDGEREVVVSVADKGQLPGFWAGPDWRESCLAAAFDRAQSLQIDRIAVEHGMDKRVGLESFCRIPSTWDDHPRR